MEIKVRSFLESQRRMLSVVYIVVQTSLLCVASCSGSPMKSWSDWVSEGMQLRGTGSYSTSARAFREALAIAESAGISDGELTEIHYLLAVSYEEAGQITEGAHEYRKVLAWIERSEGPESLDYAVVLGKMSLLGQGATSDETIAILRRALLAHRMEGSESKLLYLQSNLARILSESRRDTEAEQVLLEFRAELLKHASDREMVAESLTEFGVLRFNQERYGEAAGFYLQALQLQESVNGSEHPRMIRSLNNLATAYAKTGRLPEAHDLFRQAISLCSRTLGEDQLIYGMLLQNDGYVLRELGQKRQAKVVDEKGRRIERTFVRRNGADSIVSIAALRASAK
jgi:tetratricopeptide (TPR) repeat protein